MTDRFCRQPETARLAESSRSTPGPESRPAQVPERTRVDCSDCVFRADARFGARLGSVAVPQSAQPREQASARASRLVLRAAPGQQVDSDLQSPFSPAAEQPWSRHLLTAHEKRSRSRLPESPPPLPGSKTASASVERWRFPSSLFLRLRAAGSSAFHPSSDKSAPPGLALEEQARAPAESKQVPSAEASPQDQRSWCRMKLPRVPPSSDRP